MRNLLEEKRDASAAWLERTNPLIGMSISDLQHVFDAARGGDTQRLHWIFGEIESVNPTLMVCVDRRASAISNFSWSVSERASMDGGLSKEQKDAAERFLSDIDNFSEALEHLDLAFFRGFAHVQPIWEQDGTVRRIELLDSWNFVNRDGAWYFNPACTGFSARDLVDCRDARLMSVVRSNRRHIDYPALGVHVRDAVGNRDWGRFLERHALPKPAVTMHAGATDKDRDLYLQAAECVENGQVSVWPNGANIADFAGGSRGVDPFSSFVKHQEETLVRLATGGTLGSIAESGAGTLAGNAQADVWRSIVRRDSGVLARAVMSALVRPYLRQAFPGRPCAVDFAFDFSERPTPKEVFEMQALAKQGGYTIAQDELEEATGFTLEKLPDAAPQGPFGGLSLNASPSTPFKTPKTPSKNGSPNPRPQGDGKTADASEGVLAAFAKDTSKAAEAVKALLDDPTPEKAKALLADLPNLIPDDPALAAVIAEEMAKEFSSAASGPMPSDSSDATAENSVCRAKYPALCSEHGIWREHRDRGFQDRYGNGNPETLAQDTEMNIERGKAVFTRLARKQTGYEPHAMYRNGLGWIGVEAGTAGNPRPYDGPNKNLKGRTFLGGSGIAHILAKHPGAEKHIAETIQYGEMFRNRDNATGLANERKITIIHGNNVVIVSKHRDGRLLITEFFEDKPEKIAALKVEGPYHVRGENK